MSCSIFITKAGTINPGLFWYALQSKAAPLWSGFLYLSDSLTNAISVAGIANRSADFPTIISDTTHAAAQIRVGRTFGFFCLYAASTSRASASALSSLISAHAPFKMYFTSSVRTISSKMERSFLSLAMMLRVLVLLTSRTVAPAFCIRAI